MPAPKTTHVEHERVWVGQHEAGERELLGLGCGQRAAARPDEGVHAVRKGTHPLVGVDSSERCPDVVVGRTRRCGQGQVLAHRADEHVVLLGDQGDVTA
jgi:hypothetical protein